MPDTRTTEQDICWDLHHVITKMNAVAQKLAVAGYSTAADDLRTQAKSWERALERLADRKVPA